MSRNFIVLAIYLIVLCNGEDYSGQQVWKVTPQSEADLQSLVQLSKTYSDLDFWTEPLSVEASVDIRMTPSQMDKVSSFLLTKNIDHKVMIHDVQKTVDEQFVGIRSIEKRSAPTLEDFNYTIYHEAKEIYEWIDMIDERYDFVHKKQVATTYEGWPVYVLEITKESPDFKPAIYVDALIHCREWITTATMIKIFSDMLSTNSSMLDDIDWYFVPMINVDGYRATWAGERLWRKTRSTGVSSICTGVDANRNWDDHWSGPGTSDNPCSSVFYGPTPASESEVRHLQNYILSKKINGVLTMHAYSQLILYPFNYDFNLPPDNDKLNATAKSMHDAIKNVHGVSYVYGPGAATIYQCSGITSDWTYNQAKINMSYTYEFRDKGAYGFLLPAEQIIPSSEEIYKGVEVFASVIKDDF